MSKHQHHFYPHVEIAQESWDEVEYEVDFQVNWRTRELEVTGVRALLSNPPPPPDPWEYTDQTWKDLVHAWSEHSGLDKAKAEHDLRERLWAVAEEDMDGPDADMDDGWL